MFDVKSSIYLDPIAQGRVDETVYDEFGRLFSVEIGLLYSFLRLHLQHLALETQRQHYARDRRFRCRPKARFRSVQPRPPVTETNVPHAVGGPRPIPPPFTNDIF